MNVLVSIIDDFFFFLLCAAQDRSLVQKEVSIVIESRIRLICVYRSQYLK